MCATSLVCVPLFIYFFIHFCLEYVEEFNPLHTSNFIYLLKRRGTSCARRLEPCVFFTPLANFSRWCWLDDAWTLLGFYSFFYNCTKGKGGHGVNVGATRGKRLAENTLSHSHDFSNFSLLKYSGALVEVVSVLFDSAR